MTPNRVRDETVIQLKAVMGLPVFTHRPPYLRVWRWKKYGVAGQKLETFREGRQVFTSVEAVHRFLEATQDENYK